MTKSRAATRPSPSGNAGPSPRPLPHRRRGILLSLVRATTSLVLLLALLVALPAGLLYGTLTMAGSNPLPVHESIPTLLTSPDQGGLFAWALVAVGWIAWGCFALSVLVEIPAQLRGRMPRRLPAMGWSQRTAAGLVGAIFALLPTTGAFAATPTVVTHAPTVATAAPRPDARPAHAAVDGASLGSRVQSSDQVLYKVKDSRPAESLWSIAEAHLGSGTRWKEIARLNEGRTMDAEGRVFHAEGVIQPGWKLLMPADANGLTGPVPTTGGTDAGSGTGTGTGSDFGTGSGTMVHPAMDQAFRAADSVAAPASVDAVTATPTAAPATTAVGTGTGTGAGTGDEVTVRAGDSLSEIATDHRVPGGWPALYEANRAEIGSNPDLIQPGEQLALPAGSSSSPGGSTTTPPVTTPPVTTPPVTTPVTPPAHTAPPAHSTPPPPPGPAPAARSTPSAAAPPPPRPRPRPLPPTPPRPPPRPPGSPPRTAAAAATSTPRPAPTTATTMRSCCPRSASAACSPPDCSACCAATGSSSSAAVPRAVGSRCRPWRTSSTRPTCAPWPTRAAWTCSTGRCAPWPRPA
ncbi:LysM peptidoglycan-binding domain-containing protein [Streptacidiphilus albus]|uniref:LysM peptidoglycan-binding domain-containing protein n=1 Tax=Streptacidiphilus albus TaxID=105425 RepID=UPI00054B4CCB|nr:LysM peptidoglycan-binding domain-containing protein [Streptacidiphilus albus]